MSNNIHNESSKKLFKSNILELTFKEKQDYIHNFVVKPYDCQKEYGISACKAFHSSISRLCLYLIDQDIKKPAVINPKTFFNDISNQLTSNEVNYLYSQLIIDKARRKVTSELYANKDVLKYEEVHYLINSHQHVLSNNVETKKTSFHLALILSLTKCPSDLLPKLRMADSIVESSYTMNHLLTLFIAMYKTEMSAIK